MRKILTSLCVAMLFFSCMKEYDIVTLEKERDYLPKPTRTEVPSDDEGLMVFGPQQANPYAVSVMQQARAQLLANDPSLNIPEITTSHYYVRFHPANEEELDALLQDTTINFYDYPLDREIISGTYYHDPAIADSLPTYQYASIPMQKWFSMVLLPTTPSYEILAHLFIPEEVEGFGDDDDDDDSGLIINPGWGGGTIKPMDPKDPDNPWIPAPDPTDPGDEIGPNSAKSTSNEDVDIVSLLVNKCMVIAGLETEEEQENAQEMGGNGYWTPSGRITAYDDIVNGPVPIVGAKVLVRSWFTTTSVTTSATGQFVCNRSFSRPVNYSIKWESLRWDIRDGDYGQAYYNGPKQRSNWQLYINSRTPKSLAYASLHRALHRMYYKNLGGLSEPSRDKKIKVAYHHDSNETVDGGYYNKWWNNTGIAPLIKIYGKDSQYNTTKVPSIIFSTMCHELGGHGTHKYYCTFYNNLSKRYKEAWAVFAQYYITYIEYRDLGVLSYSQIQCAENPTIDFLDNDYNFQSWYISNASNERYDYPPIFVDIYDDYNQQNYVPKDYKDLYVNDKISYTNVFSLKNMIFSSATFSEVKLKILALYNPNNVANTYTLENINSLFDYYEY